MAQNLSNRFVEEVFLFPKEGIQVVDKRNKVKRDEPKQSCLEAA